MRKAVNPVQRREFAGRECPRPVDDRLDHVRARFREPVVAGELVHADDMLQEEFLLRHGRRVGRHRVSGWLRGRCAGYSAAP